jgi:hypothetical protein
LTTLGWGDSANHLGAILHALLGMELSFASGDSLNDQSRFFVN